MQTAVIYARYSCDQQTEQSIEGQLHVCKEYAEKNNIVILDTYIDRAMTGTNDNRPDFRRMIMDSAKRLWNMIIVYKLDRFSRNKYETAIHKKTLKDNGVKVVSAMENIPDTPEGIILESLLEGMNQYYSAELSQKVRRGMRETRLKGYYQGGGLPYGYRVEDRKIVIDEEQAQNVCFMYEQFSKGVYVRQIIEALTAKGIVYHGKPFAKNTVYNILKNEKYRGVYYHGEERIDNMYPQIVPDEIFDRVRRIIESNKHGKRSVEVTYLLRHKLICGYCGQSVIAENGTARNGERRYYYKCRGRKARVNDCKKKAIPKEELEQLVLDTIITQLKEPELMDKLISAILEEQERRNRENSALLVMQREQRQNEIALDNIMKAIERGIMNKTTNKRMKELEARQEELERLILIEKSKQVRQFTEKEVREYYEQALRMEPQLLINYLVQKIVLFDDRMEIYYNSPITNSPDDGQGCCFYKGDITLQDAEISLAMLF